MPILRPARPDLLVPIPGGSPRRYLRAEGEEIQLDSYWHRAIARGDVLAHDAGALAGSTSSTRTSAPRTSARAKSPTDSES